MKYETPELTALTPAISAVQGTRGKLTHVDPDSIVTDPPEETAAYADWE